MYKVLVIGDLYKETQYFVDQIPTANQFKFSSDVITMAGSKTLNAARILARDGIETNFYGKVGNDLDGSFIIEKLKTYNLKIDNVQFCNEKTGLIVVQTDNLGSSSITLFSGANKSFSDKDLKILENVIPSFDFIYTATNFKLEFLYKIFDICNSNHVPVFLDFPNQHKEFNLRQLDKVEFVAPNRQEVGLILEREIKSIDDGINACLELRKQCSANIILTIDSGGCIYLGKGQEECIHYPAKKGNVIDTTGAGDIFRAIFVSEYLKGKDSEKSIKRALEISGRSVEIKGVNNTIENLNL